MLAARPAQAGPFFGDWGWCWHPSGHCAPWLYSPCHYWVPTAYKLHAYVKPANLDGATILAYQKQPDEFGRRVVLQCDYGIQLLNDAQFEQTPKAGK